MAWKDAIGREHPGATSFVAICECGAFMHTHSLTGRLEFNEHGWGVWSTPHREDCPATTAAEAKWVEIRDREIYLDLVEEVERRWDHDPAFRDRVQTWLLREWLMSEGWYDLSLDEWRALRDAGVTDPCVVRVRGTDRLIRGVLEDGITVVEGWWYDGGSAADIRWQSLFAH